MNGEHLRSTMALIAGFWPTPALTEEEILSWSVELTSRMKISSEEATTALKSFAESGLDEAKFRPRPGQIVSMVQALRRKRASERPAVGALEPVTFGPDHEDVRESAIAAMRSAIGSGRKTQAQRRARVLEKAK